MSDKWKVHLGRSWQWGLSLLFALAVFLFWAVPYYSVMSYQEQLQMFLWDGDYFWELVSLPGGLSDWLGEFLVQFYFAPMVGVAILAVLFLLLQRLTYRAMAWHSADGQSAAKPFAYVLSFVPALLMWAYMGDENVMLGFVVACIFALAAMWGYTLLRAEWLRRWVYPLVMAVVLYWTMGAVVLAFALFVALWQFIDRRAGRWLTAAVTIVFTLFIILGSSTFLPFPLFRLVGGLYYYRYPAIIPLFQGVIILSLALIPVIGAMIVRRQRPLSFWRWGSVALGVLLVIAGFFGIRSQYKAKRYEVIDYDFLVRTEKWQQIISKAEKNNPTTPTSVACLNLALQQTGQMGDRMFQFYQNGVQGLFPLFQRNFTTPVPVGEIYLRLGMVNEAMRYFYEAQEAITNYRKSARLTKRLAECNLINGEYEVARKYLRKLQQTLFYRKWADRTLELMKSERAINEHHFFGAVRKNLYKEDLLSSDRELDQMIGLLLVSNKQNVTAYDYLMAYEQLNCDVDRFEQYYPLGQYMNFDHIPNSYLETHLIYWSQHRNGTNQPPAGVSQLMGQRFMEFGKQLSQGGNIESFRGTYWYYFAKMMKK